ncbi:MAG: nicotinamide-nucleotide adenylyltransferase [Candidatus Thorarchaeota archaeon]|nr:nicotinamide-nucleotide adenylyltransferase [Candidatus Thorarchaeota archaeon]
MKSVFIGRFQPIHKGHIHTIQQILDKGEDLIIVVGSAQYSHTPNNPFTGGERVMLIKQALLDAKMPLERIDIIPLSDINIHPLWIAHLKSFVPYFDKAYTHNALVQRLLKDAGIKLDETSLLERSSYSANHVRDLIRWNNKEWETLVPAGVVALIKKHKLDKRIIEVGESKTKRYPLLQ